MVSALVLGYRHAKSENETEALLHAVSDIGCECCKPDFRLKLIFPEQIMSSHVTSDTIVLAKGGHRSLITFAMQELTGARSRFGCSTSA